MTQGTAPLGARIGPYEIVGWLGAGGMGEVYRARDPRLGRDVALKLITRTFAADAGRVRRFEQEARAAGQLNHPNVLAVYDIGTHEGVPYIVSELLEGRSLRSRLIDGPLPWRKVLDYARQAAEGLAAAHDRGIVHRDVKPDNLFITTDGRVKILDFGIAKLASPDDESGHHTGLPTDTAAGTVVGTAAYMSPEQVRGESVDARSDIFSLGAVIHEMITGRSAFRRDTSAETLAAILKEDPPEPAAIADTPTLARIVSRCLEKTRETRFQSARDLAFGLDVLSGTKATAVADVAPRRRWLAAMTVAIVASSAAAAIWLVSRRSEPIENLLIHATMQWFTDFEGSEVDATISRDGKVVAFMADRDGPFHVWVKPVGTGSFQDLTPDRVDLVNAGPVRNIGFNFDGSELWLNGTPTGKGGTPGRRLTLLPVMGGGTPRVFLAEHAANVAWSSDGTRLVYFTNDGDPIIVADADDNNESRILSARGGDHNHFVVFSPDNRWIYYAHADQSLFEYDIYRIPAGGGTPEALARLHTDVRDLTPIDNRWVLFVAHANDGSGPWLWGLDVDRKETHRVSVGLDRYLSLAATADGRRLVASIVKSTAAGLWSIPIRDGLVEEREVTPFTMSSARALSPRFGSASTLFYLSSSGGGDGLWRIQDGRAVDIRMGASARIVETPSVSKNGDRVAVVVGTPGKKRITIVSADGADRRPLSDAVDVRGTSTWSADGTSIITGGSDEHGPGLFSIPVDGGAPRRLMSGPAADPVLSPDGQIIVYVGRQTPVAPLLAMRIDGTPVPLPTINVGGAGRGRFRFLPDGRLVCILGDLGAQDFWSLDIQTQHTQQMTKLSSPATINTFDISPDGSRIVFDRLRDLADVALIDLAKR